MKISACILVLLSILTIGFVPTVPPSSGADKVIYLVRHGETCTEQGSDAHLSAYGKARAAALARVLMDVDVQEIFSTSLNRTLETATPTSESQQISITQISTQSGFLEELASKIRESSSERILVSGHSNTTPPLVNLLLGTELANLTEFEFDRLYIVTLNDSGTGSLSVLRYGDESGRPAPCLP